MTSAASLLQHSHSGLPKQSTPVVDNYGLTRDKTESARLNAQHNVWKTNIGFLLHPRIASSLGKTTRIGDIGTGAGVWILELARPAREAQRGDVSLNVVELDNMHIPKTLVDCSKAC